MSWLSSGLKKIAPLVSKNPWVGAGLGLLGGRFLGGGGKQFRQPDALSGQFNRLQGLGNFWASDAEKYAQQANSYQGMTDRSTAEALNALRSNPYAGAGGSQMVAQGYLPAAQMYDQSAANLASQLAQRGLGQSSVAAGGLGALESARYGTLAGLQNQAAMKKYEVDRQNALERQQLLAAMLGRYQALVGQSRQGAAGVYGSGMDYYGRQNDISRANQQQQKSDLTNLLGALAGAWVQSRGK